MDERDRLRLRLVTALFALVVAGIHLLHPTHGGHAVLVYAAAGYLGDPRPLLFALGGFALIFGVVLGFNDLDGPRVYLAGIVLALAFLLSYGLWHTVFDHGNFWPYIEPHGHTDGHTVVIVLKHLLYDRLALASKLAELGLLVCLVVLYRTTSRSRQHL